MTMTTIKKINIEIDETIEDEDTIVAIFRAQWKSIRAQADVSVVRETLGVETLDRTSWQDYAEELANEYMGTGSYNQSAWEAFLARQ